MTFDLQMVDTLKTSSNDVTLLGYLQRQQIFEYFPQFLHGFQTRNDPLNDPWPLIPEHPIWSTARGFLEKYFDGNQPYRLEAFSN